MIKTKGTAIAERFAALLAFEVPAAVTKALAAEIDCAIALALACGQSPAAQIEKTLDSLDVLPRP